MNTIKHSFISFWRRIGNWSQQHKRLAALLVVLGMFTIGASTWALLNVLLAKPKPQTIATVAPKPKPKPPVKYYSPLTGLEVKDKAAATQPVTAIMIENSPDARPQSGIKDAGIIYEAVAEGGITRFLAMYQESKPQLIGPVRSLRMHFLDWAAPYNASIAHIGGSYAALQEVRNGQYRDIDQFFNAGSYWRANDRYAPHNVYTSFEKLDALNREKGYNESSFTGFKRTNGKPSKEPTATSVDIAISSALYNASYAYDAASNTYTRSLGGEPHKDREKDTITPNVVIAMYVNMQKILQDGYREDITTTGTGKAVIFQNGIAIEATWTKEDRAKPLIFTDVAGKEILLNRGQTWISAVPNSGGSAVWK